MARESTRKSWWLFAGLAVLAYFAWSRLHDAGDGRETHRDATASDGAPSQNAGRAANGALEFPPPLNDSRPAARSDYPDFLPNEAIRTLELIARGGPYPHRQDDGVFQNREHKLPDQPRGYYREYTVETPGSRDRGARRIIAGGQPPTEYFYTDDHYRHFRRFTLNGSN